MSRNRPKLTSFPRLNIRYFEGPAVVPAPMCLWESFMIPAVMATYDRFDIAFERGEGAYLYSTDGRRFLDFGAESP